MLLMLTLKLLCHCEHFLASNRHANSDDVCSQGVIENCKFRGLLTGNYVSAKAASLSMRVGRHRCTACSKFRQNTLVLDKVIEPVHWVEKTGCIHDKLPLRPQHVISNAFPRGLSLRTSTLDRSSLPIVASTQRLTPVAAALLS